MKSACCLNAWYPLLPLVLVFGLLASCSNDLEVNAPPKDVYIIYGILNPQQAVQTIRIARAFQTEGNALEYAKANDLSLQGLQVRLRYTPRGSSSERVIELTQVDTVRESTQFADRLTYYQTREPILDGTRYTLEVRRPGEERAIATAQTTVPVTPFIRRPSPQLIANPDSDVRGNIESYPYAFFNVNTYALEITKSRDGLNEGAAYEMRFFLNYSETPGGPTRELVFGPTPFITASNASCIGTSPDRDICYRVGMQVQNFLSAYFANKPGFYDDGLMSQAARIEVSAVDEALYNYIRVNSPAFVDFTTVRPEYTNIEGGLGVFGSTNSNTRFVRLTQCTKYLARLNNTPAPDTRCPS